MHEGLLAESLREHEAVSIRFPGSIRPQSEEWSEEGDHRSVISVDAQEKASSGPSRDQRTVRLQVAFYPCCV